MKKIASFTINHNDLLPGIYVSRTDTIGKLEITTFDIRFTKPNREPVMGTAEVHTLEHLCATFLRNDIEWGAKTIYFGPMGCRTGFYAIFAGKYESIDVAGIIEKMLDFVISYEGEIPGAKPSDCGNYLDMNLSMAKYYAKQFKKEVFEDMVQDHYHYPI